MELRTKPVSARQCTCRNGSDQLRHVDAIVLAAVVWPYSGQLVPIDTAITDCSSPVSRRWSGQSFVTPAAST